MLNLVFSNRYEILREHLLDALEGPVDDPLRAQQVIVPSLALRRDLTLAVARRQGVCANIEFGFLAQWVWRQVAKAMPGVAAESPFAANVLCWRVFAILDDRRFVAAHPRLTAYVSKADAVMRYELALRIAGLFEQYLSYRPDWLAAWATSETVTFQSEAARDDARWQAALWRRLLADIGVQGEHPAFEFARQLTREPATASRLGLPPILHLFALPAIPPLYLELLRQLAQVLDIRLYLLNPCQEYWFEIVDAQRLAYLAARGEANGHEVGNRLLAGWGRQTRACIERVLDVADESRVDEAEFVHAQRPSLLAHLQNAMLELRELQPGEVAFDPHDQSIEVHLCHSLTRQLEVLHGRLLGLFDADRSLRPDDVLVVVPDLEAAAPLIDAVFGTAPYARRIGYTITGRSRSSANPVAAALLTVLALAASRLAASEVHGVLQLPLVQQRFGITADELDMLRDWMQEAGMRWAADGRHRAHYGVPDDSRFSFDEGLQRLFRAYALPAASGELAVEGGSGLLLGRFNEFMRRIAQLRRLLTEPVSLAQWSDRLQEVLERFIAVTADEADALAEVRDTLASLRQQGECADFAAPVSSDVLRTLLKAELDEAARGGIPTGDVTFAALPSLRTLPYRVVCVLGMDDGVFPSAERRLEFDLMQIAPRLGDRQRREDERNLFLDLLLAARERLMLAYTGRDVRDNASRPSSILVAELLEVALAALATDRATARAHLVIEHPLQAFSPRCFSPTGAPRLASYDSELCAALQAAHGAATTGVEAPAPVWDDVGADDEAEDFSAASDASRLPFFIQPLPPPDADARQVSLTRLIRFFCHPSRYVLRERLGLHFERDEDEIADAEPFAADWRATQQLAHRLLPALKAGTDRAALRAMALAGTEYPAGPLGAAQLDEALARLQDFAARVSAIATGEPLPPHTVAFEVEVDGELWQLSGVLSTLHDSGNLRMRFDKLRPRDRIEAWLEHLFLCIARPAGVAPVTHWVSSDGGLRLRVCEDATAHLGELLRLYRRGLSAPLHFFPRAAWAYVEGEAALGKARAVWQDAAPGYTPEGDDIAYRQALRGVEQPLDDEFAACAQTLFGPLRVHAEEWVA